jgi:VWA domain-containing protein
MRGSHRIAASGGSRRPPGAPTARLLLILAVLAVTLLGSAQDGAGFGTIVGPIVLPGIGQVTTQPDQNAEHERITRRALACVGPAKPGDCFEEASLLTLAGNGAAKPPAASLTYGTVGQPDQTAGVTALPFDADYHCDDGDYNIVGVKTTPPYPQTKTEANAALGKCRATLTRNFEAAVTAAKGVLSAPPTVVVIADQVQLRSPNPLTPNAIPCFSTGFASAKCKALRSFGWSLHIAQDFYAHTNWADDADRRLQRGFPIVPISIENPPGLLRTGLASYLNLLNPGTLPKGLISGCFQPGELSPVVGGCTYGGNAAMGFMGFGANARIRHLVLQKDEGVIDSGQAVVPGDPVKGPGVTRRGRIGDNFKRAVELAIRETRRKWREFRTALEQDLVASAGADPAAQASARRRAAGIICAMVHDDPVSACTGRYAALVIDSSGSNSTTDPNGLRRAAAEEQRVALVSAAEAGAGGVADRLTVVDFDSSASVTYPLGDPDDPSAVRAIAAVDESGGTHIAAGVLAALAELSKAGPPPDKSGIVLFTDGEDSDQAALVAAIDAATAKGVRTSYGKLVVGQTIAERPVRRSHQVGESGLEAAIVRSGGVFATIRTPEDQRTFIRLVERRGLTTVDDPDGADDGGRLALGLDVSGLLEPAGDTDTWTYDATAGEGVKVTLTPPAGVVGRLALQTEDDRSGAATGPSPAGAVTLSARATVSGPITIEVGGAGQGLYTLKVEADPAAPALALPRIRTIAPGLVVAVGPGRVSLTPRGRSLRVLRRGAAPVVSWRVRARRATRLRLEVRGPRNARLRLSSRVRRGPSTITARLPILGSRRGGWRVDLVAGDRVIASSAVATR